MPNNCVPFEASRRASARRRDLAPAPVSGLTEMFDHMSPAQYAFLSGVLAILSEHGEEALTKSCQMVIDRFGRHHAG